MEPGLGSKLPLIMVKGYPANLHKMTLVQLKKFVPFMVICATKSSLPIEINSAQPELPPWWPPDIPFCQNLLSAENLPSNELIERFLKIITACYRHHHSSYIIDFSCSLSTCNLTFIETGDGTATIVNDNQQLVVVIRSATRHYDDDPSPRHSNTRSGDKCIDSNSDIVTTDFKKTFSLTPLLVRIDDPEALKPKPEANMVRQLRSLNPRKVVDDITNQLKSESRVEVEKAKSKSPKAKSKSPKAQSKSPKAKATSTRKPKPKQPPKKGRGKKRGCNVSKQNVPEPDPVPRSCKYCHSSFPEEYLCLEHEDVCRKIPPEGQDLRDLPERMDLFAEALGLAPIKPTPAPKNLTADVDVKEPEFKIPLVPAKRNLRKVPARNKMVTFVKANPIPITSLRGQEFLEKFGERKKPSPISSTPTYDKDCRSTQVWPPPHEPQISTLKKHKIKDDQYLHHYTSGNNNRRLRNVELVVGMSSTSFKEFNKCKRPAVKVTKLSKETVDKVQARAMKKRKAIDIDRIVTYCRPIIPLRDCIQDPEALTKSQRKKLKINTTVRLIL